MKSPIVQLIEATAYATPYTNIETTVRSRFSVLIRGVANGSL